jgi:hypothetical protein
VSRCDVRCGVTYLMLVTLLTSQAPMSWSKTDSENMKLYADTQHTEEGREGEGRTLRQVTVHGSGSEWVIC